MDLDLKASNLSQKMIEQVYRFLDEQAEKHDEEFKNMIEVSFLAKLVGRMVFNSLMKKPMRKMGKKDLYEFTWTNFRDTKSVVQEAVAAGFSGAIGKYSGMPMEYWCQVTPVPDPINREPC